ncbi:endonuclease domain-containing protein [Sphingomonas psychrolutea]|nr:endonuclease domain-containing protein [Sphingomonas psychrolutea]
MTEPQFRRPTVRAQQLRRDMTEIERVLWQQMRGRRLNGLKFSRQMPVGPYICDFLCRTIGLVVEIDGGQHGEAAAYDEARTRFIENEGYRVLRFWNNEVLENMEGVLTRIVETARTMPTPQPPPASGRGSEKASLPLAGWEEKTA